MKKIIFLLGSLVIASIIAMPCLSERRFSRQWGEKLFESPSLGGSGNKRYCRSCHSKDDKDFPQKILGLTKEEITVAINRCIKEHLRGKPLKVQSPELKSLRLYVTYIGDSSLD